jgi:hypothetical protein
MKWIPRIDYLDATGGAQSLVLTLPMAEWRKSEKRYGGTHIASSRVRAAYTIRRDSLLVTPLRYSEAQRAAVAAMVAALQDTGGAATIFPDKDVATSYAAYLEAPLDDWNDTPDPEGPRGFFRTEVTWSRTTGAAWPMEFHG